MAYLLDAQLLDLLVERVGFVLARLPAGVDPERFFGEADVHREQLRDGAIARALGWIEGLADAVDLTVLELLDTCEIVVAAMPHHRCRTGGPGHRPNT